jgi:hypothetical protein
MGYRDFGRTGWRVSAISFGSWQLGGRWGDVDDEASIRSLLHAYGSGVNFVDTAEYYGEGHSEGVIGESLRRWDGGRIYVAAKSRPTVWPSPDEDDPLMWGRYPEWHLRSNLEQSCVDWASSASTSSSCMAGSTTLLDARGDKPVPESTTDEVHAANWQWVEFMGEPEPVAAVQDTYIPGPTAELHIRIYTPQG